MLGVNSVRKKKHFEQMMKVHMVKYCSISNSLNVIDVRKGPKNHDINYHNKPVMFKVSLELEIGKFKRQAILNIINLNSSNKNINKINL